MASKGLSEGKTNLCYICALMCPKMRGPELKKCLKSPIFCNVYDVSLNHFISCHIISYHFISFHFNFISYHFISYHFISCHIISCHIISFHVISFHFISYHFISYHLISFHVISFHFISYHFISYHIMSFHIISCTSTKKQRELEAALPRNCYRHHWHLHGPRAWKAPRPSHEIRQIFKRGVKVSGPQPTRANHHHEHGYDIIIRS